jgi:site-specific recombinase XerD
MLNKMGVSDMTIALIVGHSSVDTTKGYTHIENSTMDEIIKKVEKLWQGDQEQEQKRQP